MYDKMRAFLRRSVDVLLVFIALAATAAYFLFNGMILTDVINSLRLDTYVSLDVGLGIVFLILSLGWGPVWLKKQFYK